MWEKRTIPRGLWHTVFVPGDKSVPPTRWWNRAWLCRWFWKPVVFGVWAEAVQDGYRVGYRLPGDELTIWVKQEVRHEEWFAMRIGHEACYFFALDAVSGEEILIHRLGVVGLDVPIH